MSTERATWSDQATVDGYLDRAARRSPRDAGEELLLEILPVAPARVLDLGCGDGRLASMILDARPSVTEAVAIDSSPPMLELARERFADDPRARVVAHDLSDAITDLGRFDAIVSGLAIHHVDDDRKQALFAEIAAQLEPGGVVANIEVVMSATPEWHEVFLAAIGRPADDPEDQLVDVETQLRWMREAGLEQVDCLWRWRGFALLVGQSAA